MSENQPNDPAVDPRALLLALTDAANRHDPDECALFYAEDAEVIDIGSGRHVRGRAAICENLSRHMAASPDLRIEKRNVLVEDDRFADEFTWSGTDRMTGRRFRLTQAGFGDIRDGKIVRHALYGNVDQLRQQLGLVPEVTTTAG